MLRPLAFAAVLVSASPAWAQPPESPSAAPRASRVLRLEDAQRAALQHQPTILQAQASTRAAEGRAEQARSGLLPQVTATASYQRISRSSNVSATTTTTGGTSSAFSGTGVFDFWSFGIAGTQLLWDFGQTYERYRAADRTVDAIRANERTSELAVLLNVRRAYFQARAQRALIRVAEESLANYGKHLQQIQGFVNVGTRPEIDLAQARADIATARVQLVNAQGGYDLAKSQLNQAMGVPGPIDYDVTEEELAPIEGEDGAPDRLVDRAIAARPELTGLERQREAQEMTVRAYKGGYGPTLSASAGASETGTALDALGPNWNVGITLAWPIFQGFLTTGQVREARANLESTRWQLEGARLQVRFDVEQALLNVRGAKAALAASQEAAANVRERLRLAEGRYTSGVGSIIELGDAQVAVATAAAQVVQAQFNLSAARAQLLAALGRR